MSFYEQWCGLAESLLALSPPKELEKRYAEAIRFANLNITPRGAFSGCLLAFLSILLLPAGLSYALGFFQPGIFFLSGIFAAIASYFLYDYPMHRASVLRIQASSEMALCTIYMATAMRLSPNLERALNYAAQYLKDPLAEDLKRLLWEVYARRYSLERAFDRFVAKWKRENEEFAEALYLLKTALAQSRERMERVCDEAIAIMLTGTKQRMKRYARELITPVMIVNALGILLPLIGVVFFPLMAMFLPELVQPAVLAVSYACLLPLSVHTIMKFYLERRPYAFHQPDLSRHPEFRKESAFQHAIPATCVAGMLILLGSSQLAPHIALQFSPAQLYASLLISLGAAAGIITYCLLSSRHKLKLRETVIRIESEFPEALFQLGNRLMLGIPLERALKECVPRIKHLSISNFFATIVRNMETHGCTLSDAIFHHRYGAINYYPSTLIDAISRAVVETYKKGAQLASKAMLKISTYLKDVRSVEEGLRELMAETASSLQIQALLLAPLAAGIVVALAAVIMQIFVALGGMMEPYYKGFEAYGMLGDASKGLLSSFVNLNQLIPIHWFQLVVGVYLIQVVALMASFASSIEHGEESVVKRVRIGKSLLMSSLLYALIAAMLYALISTMIPQFAYGA